MGCSTVISVSVMTVQEQSVMGGLYSLLLHYIDIIGGWFQSVDVSVVIV